MKEKMKAIWETATCEVVVFNSLDVVTASDPYEGELDPAAQKKTSYDW